MASGDFLKRVSDSAKEFAENFADKAEDAIEVLSDKAEDALSVAKEKGTELKERAQSAIADNATPHMDRVKEMYAMIGQGKVLEAFDKYYDDSVVMQENSDEPRRGKAVNRASLEEFFADIVEHHGGGVGAITSNEKEGVTMVESWMDATFKGGGRMKMEEVAIQKWKGGKIVHERFYHNMPQ